MIDTFYINDEKENLKQWKRRYWWIINNITGCHCFHRLNNSVFIEIDHRKQPFLWQDLMLLFKITPRHVLHSSEVFEIEDMI